MLSRAYEWSGNAFPSPYTIAMERRNVRPIFIGDDKTDEDAFRALCGPGVSIYVGQPDELDRDTAAEFTLDSPAEVERFLDTLAR